jgi:hypothetical protein
VADCASLAGLFEIVVILSDQGRSSNNPSRENCVIIEIMSNPNKVGLVVAALIGGWHVLWSLLVLLGWAQPILDFIFWAT